MGLSLGTSLGRFSTVGELSPPRPTPSPHLLSCGAVLGGPSNRLLYDPCPMVGTVGRGGGGSTEEPIKSLHHITVGHLLGTVADELWEILAHARTACVPLVSHRGGARRTLMYETFG